MDQKTPGETAEIAGQRIAQETIDAANTTMPGGRAALPEGTLKSVHDLPQADEHRNAPIIANK